MMPRMKDGKIEARQMELVDKLCRRIAEQRGIETHEMSRFDVPLELYGVWFAQIHAIVAEIVYYCREDVDTRDLLILLNSACKESPCL